MRVSTNTFPETLVSQLQLLGNKQYRLQAQATSGQKIQNVEDDPVAVHRVLNLQTEIRKNNQFEDNINILKERAVAASNVFSSLKKITDRTTEITVLADSLKSGDELTVYANEIDQLIQQGVDLVNRKYRGEQLFSGTASDQTPFVLQKDAAGQITGVNYQGNNSVRQIEIAENTLMNDGVPGANNTGSGAQGVITDSRSGADLFNHLIALRDHLRAGDVQAVSESDHKALSADEENLIQQIGSNGIFQERMEMALRIASDVKDNMGKIVSGEVDADLAETMTRLSSTQTAYQAALQVGATLFRTSLLDYLR